jgi:hypothetical protein
MAARPSTMIHTQGRPSMARTNETVERVDAVIRGNRRLMIRDCLHNRSATPSRCSSSETDSQIVFRYLASAPRQCAMPRGPECQGIIDQAQHLRGSPPASLTRFGPLRLLPLPQAEQDPEGETISRRRGDTTKYDTAVAGHSQTSLPNMK